MPSASLIGPDGTVVWQGHPGSLSDDEIETQLEEVEKANRVSTWAFLISSQIGALPDALKGVKKLLEKMKFGAALKKVEATLGKLEGDDAEAGERVRAWIAQSGEGGIEAASGLVRDGQIYKAYLKYEEIEDRFKGHDLSKQAKAAGGALKKGKETKLEIKASKKLEDIKTEMRGERKAEDQLALLKPMLSKKYADTLAGKQAAEMAAELEKKVEK